MTYFLSSSAKNQPQLDFFNAYEVHENYWFHKTKKKTTRSITFVSHTILGTPRALTSKKS
jgi:hypothetical protein